MGYYINGEANVKLFVEDINPFGSKTILFLHGWPGSHRLFEYQFNQLPKMGFRCIGIDTRGFGKSDKPWSGYDYNTLADDVRLVIDTLKLQDITLAGHSTGGAIAIRYMSRHHGHGVSNLALFAAAAPSLIKRNNFPYGLDLKTVEQIITNSLNDRPNMLRNFGEIFFFQHTSEALSDWFFQLGLEAASWATVAIANTWLEEVLFQDLRSISIPTLIIHGIHDKVVPFTLGQIQNQSISNSELIPFHYSGHATFYDERERFNKELSSFMNNSFC